MLIVIQLDYRSLSIPYLNSIFFPPLVRIRPVILFCVLMIRIVIHFTKSSVIESELPRILQFKNSSLPHPLSDPAVPSSSSSSPSPLFASAFLRPGNNTTRGNIPQALLLGAAFSDSEIAKLQALVKSMPGTMKIPWVRADPNKSNLNPRVEGDAYRAEVVGRLKDGLARLKQEGRLDVIEKEGVEDEGVGGVYSV